MGPFAQRIKKRKPDLHSHRGHDLMGEGCFSTKHINMTQHAREILAPETRAGRASTERRP